VPFLKGKHFVSRLDPQSPFFKLDPCQVLTIVYQCRELHQYFTFAPTTVDFNIFPPFFFAEPGHSWINYCDTKDFPPATHLKVPFKADGRLCWWELGMVIEDGWYNSLELVELNEIHHKEHGKIKSRNYYGTFYNRDKNCHVKMDLTTVQPPRPCRFKPRVNIGINIFGDDLAGE